MVLLKFVRIVLNHKYRSKAEAVLEATGIDNLSQLFTLLLVHYGDRFFSRHSAIAHPLGASLFWAIALLAYRNFVIVLGENCVTITNYKSA